MKLVCPRCSTSYDVAPAALGSEGRQVRCVRCQSVWFAEPPKLDAEVSVLAVTVPASPEAIDGAAPPSAPVITVDVSPAAPTSEQPAAGAEPSIIPLPGADIESVASRISARSQPVKRRRPAGRRMRWLAAATVALAVTDAGLIAGRAEVVRVLPQTASLFETIGLPVNLRDLAFKDIKTTRETHDTTRETHDDVAMLVIEGTIVATGGDAVDVPRLRFSIGAANGHEIYAWTALPTRSKLAPGETLAFRTRLAAPPEQGRSVQVRFFNRLDLASGLR